MYCNDPQFINFGDVKDVDMRLGIRSGQLKILGYVCFSDWPGILDILCSIRSDVASFFAPSIECIKESIEVQRAGSETIISACETLGFAHGSCPS